MGNFFAIYGSAAMSLPDDDPLFSSPGTMQRTEFAEKMREGAEACLALVNDIDSPNDFVVALMQTAYMMQSQTDGDSSKSFALLCMDQLKAFRPTIVEALRRFGHHYHPAWLT